MEYSQDIYNIFLSSSTDILDRTEKILLELDPLFKKNINDKLQEIFRAAHTLKGDAGVLHLEYIVDTAHKIESMLEAMQKEYLPILEVFLDLQFKGFDLLRELLQNKEQKPKNLQSTLEQIENISQILKSINPGGSQSGLEHFSQDSSETDEPGPDPDRKSRQDSSLSRISVSASTLDTLIDSLGELVTLQTRLNKQAERMGGQELLAVAEAMDSLGKTIQSEIMTMRMIPVKTMFQKSERMLRDLAQSLNKNILVETSGENITFDKAIIERLNGPMLHLLRNSIDHGIEPEQERREKGKTLQGKISLSATQNGNEACIIVADDGRGLDPERLWDKALELGLVREGQVLDTQEKLDLIFLPGVSLSSQVSTISGRGIGMDSVRTDLQAIRGKIFVSSKPNKGTVFEMKFPLSMAIIECLEVSCQGERFFIELESVDQCLELSNYQTRKDQKKMLLNLSTALPLLDLASFYHLSGPCPEPAQIVVVKSEDQMLGIVVDEIVGRHPAVFKNLGAVFKSVPGIQGGTVSENGQMGLILDHAQIIRKYQKK